jgi:hypothetical protein
MTDTLEPLPGFIRRDEYMARFGKSDFTGRRWQQKGEIVVVYFGKEPFVDLEATARRMRGEDKPRRRRGRAA